jgi:hypothetical protein
MHVLPEAWRRPSAWRRLERLALKSECAQPMAVEIGGLDAQRGFVMEPCELPPLKRVAARQEFYSLAYIRTGSLPEKRLGLHSPQREKQPSYNHMIRRISGSGTSRSCWRAG